MVVPSIVTAPAGPVWISPPAGISSPECTARLSPSGNSATAPVAACSSKPWLTSRFMIIAAVEAAAARPSPATSTWRRRRRIVSTFVRPDGGGVTTNSR